MSRSSEQFERDGFIILKNHFTKDQCRALVERMFSLYRNGQLFKDRMCPLSDAVYGDPVFDEILQNCTVNIGDTVGKTLLPTNSYARIYRPEEELKKHKDRPACEISATITLGYESNTIWPIFFGEDLGVSAILDVGDMAVYKGHEISHWRERFQGQWHVQVFLHYVDKNGPYKDHFMDGRKALGTKRYV